MFLSRNKKIMCTQVLLYKSGVYGGQYYIGMFSWWCSLFPKTIVLTFIQAVRKDSMRRLILVFAGRTCSLTTNARLIYKMKWPCVLRSKYRLEAVIKRNFQGPVVQSVVSLTSSLRVISLTVLADSLYNIPIFFAEKNVSSFCTAKATHIFSAKNFSIFAYHSM